MQEANSKMPAGGFDLANTANSAQQWQAFKKDEVVNQFMASQGDFCRRVRE
jgi:hypothetical protein